MGAYFSALYWEGKTPEHIPPENFKPTFDPNYGFKAPRLPRVSKISQQEMKALQLEKSERDYCAHFLKDYKICMRQYKPFYIFCNSYRHGYKQCETDDLILRMKEYEREKRLRLREIKKQKKDIQ